MPKMRDNGPALRALTVLGYRLSNARFFERPRRGVRDIVFLRDPQGRERRIKIQKSGVPTGHDGRACYRHWFGIAFQSFDDVDDFVLWAKDEAVMYIIPTTVLREAKDTPGETPRILKGIQWSTDIYFDRHELIPTGYGAATALGEYKRPVPATANA